MKKIKIENSIYNNETKVAICDIKTEKGYFRGESNLDIDKLDYPSAFLQSDIARIRAIQEYIKFIIAADTTEALTKIQLQNETEDKKKKNKYKKQIQRLKEKIDRNKKKNQDLEQRINDLIIERRLFLQKIKEKKEKGEN